MTLEEIRKNIKTFKELALRQIECIVENWVDKYCDDCAPSFDDMHPEIVKHALLDDEDLMEELSDYVAVLIQVKVINE